MKDILKKYRTRYVLVKVDPERASPIKITEDVMAAIKELMGDFAIFRVEIKIVDLNKKGYVLLKCRYYDINPQFLYLAISYARKFDLAIVPIKAYGTIKSAKSAFEFL